MSIQIHCPNCTSDFGVKHLVCPKCGTPVGKAKKFRVQVLKGKKRGGGRITKLVEGSLSLARTVEGKLKAQLAEGRYLDVKEEVRYPTLAELWELYSEWSKANKKSWKDDKSRWNRHLEEPLGKKRMDKITTIDVEKAMDRMRQGKEPYKPATIKNVHAQLRGMYNWAMDRDLYQGVNPAEKVKLPRYDNKITRYLDKKHLKKLLKTIDKAEGGEMRFYGLCVKMALYTGLRQGEILNLQWADVDEAEMFLTIKDAKGVEANTLPMNDLAFVVLKEAKGLYPDIESGYCFPAPNGDKKRWCYKYWVQLRDAAKLPKEFRFHDLRHTYATYLASSGKVDLYTLQKLMTHKSPQMTQRYAHLMNEALRRGADVVGEVFGVE